MTNTQKALTVILVVLALLTVLSVFGDNAQATSETSLLEWSEYQCEQGNPDACQLERNLLLGK